LHRWSKKILGLLVIEPDEDSNLATARLLEDAIANRDYI
jgi:hypothetical protein